MSRGKVIEIHLIDGKPSGLRSVKVLGKTIQVFACSRNDLSKLTGRTDINKPGIYFLIGKKNQEDSFYIGETENIDNRIKEHLSKEFWNQVIVFNSTDKKLNKAYVKFLEAKIIQELIEASQVNVENTTNPKEPSLSDAELDYLRQFKEDIFLILGTLGYPGINKKARIFVQKDLKETKWQPESLEDYTFELKRKKKGVLAHLVPTNNGLMLLKGAKFIEPTESFLNDPGLRSSRNRRNKLLEEGSLVKEGDYWNLTKDVLFKSPSGAAEVVLGRSANGRVEWTTSDDKTFAEVEANFLNRKKQY